MVTELPKTSIFLEIWLVDKPSKSPPNFIINFIQLLRRPDWYGLVRLFILLPDFILLTNFISNPLYCDRIWQSQISSATIFTVFSDRIFRWPIFLLVLVTSKTCNYNLKITPIHISSDHFSYNSTNLNIIPTFFRFYVSWAHLALLHVWLIYIMYMLRDYIVLTNARQSMQLSKTLNRSYICSKQSQLPRLTMPCTAPAPSFCTEIDKEEEHRGASHFDGIYIY